MARRGKNNRARNSSDNHKKVDTSDSRDVATQAQSEEVESKEGKNDVAWYARDPQLCVDAARIPFSLPFGADVPEGDYLRTTAGQGAWETCSQIETFNNYSEESIPGICSLSIKPSFGTNGKKTDPVNVCANAFYTHVRYMNSGRKNYDPADLFMYAATFGDLISFIVWAKRIYQYAFMYSQRNYYIGKALIEANGIIAEDILTNLANFRYLINTWINKVSSFCLPGDIYYFSRRAFMFGNFYIENNYGNLKDQLYQFIPDGFYKFVLDEQSGAGQLKYTKCDRFGQRGIAWMSSFFDALFENITGDEDFGIMSGDILKAYGDNRIFLSSLGEEATILPVYDPYVLSQFKNATAALYITNAETDINYHVPGHEGAVSYGDLVQFPGDGNLYSREAMLWPDNISHYLDLDIMGNMQGAAVQPHLPPILSSENPNPDVGDVIEGSRLIAATLDEVRPTSVGSGEDKAWIQEVSCGTELVMEISYCTINHDNLRRELLNFTKLHSSCIGSTYFAPPVNDGYGPAELNVCCQFKYGPMIRLAQFDRMTTDNQHPTWKLQRVTIMSNTDNLAVCSNENIKRLHEVALLSLFFVPGVAKIM